jgi:hypothetical protein
MPKRSGHAESGSLEGFRERPREGMGSPEQRTKNEQARTAIGHAGLRCKNPAIPTLALLALPSALEA